MAWLQLHIPSTAERAESVEDALMALGASAVTLADAADQPLFEPPPGATPLWRETIVSALFEADADEAVILAGLQAHLGEAPADHRFETLADQAWERAWMDDFQPMSFGERLWIVPSWAEPLSGDAVNLHLDPGLAFGTGTHETTAMCLRWLDGADLTGRTVLDFGCGSGVLAIAALLLGAERALACDIDPQALLATRENARLNGVADRLEVCLPALLQETSPATRTFDLVIANILAGPLVELAPQLMGHCAPGAALVLSGILAEQADTVAAAYRPTIQFDAPARDGDWVRLAGHRTP